MANSSNEKSVHLKTNNFQRVRELSRKQQGVLSLALLERMKPNYQLFGWGGGGGRGGGVGWAGGGGGGGWGGGGGRDFDMYGVYPAIYFCTGLLTYINGELSEDEYDSVAIAKISQGCIVHLIEYQAGETELDNESIREHELMAAEMSVLTELLDWLSTTRLKDLDLKAIRTKALDIVFADGVTNIGIELEG